MIPPGNLPERPGNGQCAGRGFQIFGKNLYIHIFPLLPEPVMSDYRPAEILYLSKGGYVDKKTIAVIGAGNIGTSIANGLVESGFKTPGEIILTRRKEHLLDDFKGRGFMVTKNNTDAVNKSDVVIVAVEPLQMVKVLKELSPALVPGRHVLISVVTGISVSQILAQLGKPVAVIRAMPNTAIAVRESMTTLASDASDPAALRNAREIFETVGKVMVIDEEQMNAATVLGACGIAYFLRAIRAASQGGIEIGFHSHDALAIAAQTAKGAAILLQKSGRHPEEEIDKVTTPRGVTIAGLNQMEHEGFSSAIIKGIITSANKAAKVKE